MLNKKQGKSMSKKETENKQMTFAFAALLFEKCANIINNVTDIISGDKELKIELKSKPKSKRR